MDHQSGFNARTLRYHSNVTNIALARFLKLLCLAKSLTPVEAHLQQTQHDISIIDGDFPVTGAVTICDYLEERYPFPQCMPADPRLRAIARMTITKALESPQQQLEAALPTEGFLFSKVTPTAADIAVAAVLPASDFARRTLRALQSLAQELNRECSES